ncbi:TfuA-like protein [Ancylobacter defluvii]|uniref:TfuA domain-containing protein n=1 Tax=Ancylobacter defluvii TaxID=1282440 RepID=A0A9W6NCL1_9HYPH|nr:TfuA-like protein [Ancylobacter defluvii]MBS7586470.1 TfuA-like protein [Ancylobacter defluvii]GLK85752.1 TfuA domain-containing protein [Ancylobacter defluvii]
MTSREDIVVFLGPTLPRERAMECLEATYLPPAEQGSLVRTVRALKPRLVVLIDGSFSRVPAVRHKEILWTLAQNIPVIGAASIGAVRAAELGPVGMQGHGLIYRWYRRTPFADDDEVAVAMMPAELGAAPLSDALINIRLTLGAARRAGILSEALRRAIETVARRTYFIDRLYAPIIASARSVLPAETHAELGRFERWWPDNAIDQKRADAIGLLRRLAATPGLPGPPAVRPAFRLTEAWAHDLDAAGLLTSDIADVP